MSTDMFMAESRQSSLESSTSLPRKVKAKKKSYHHHHHHRRASFTGTVIIFILSFCRLTLVVNAMTTPAAGNGSSLSYDLVVVGGGSAGLTAAKLAGTTLKKSVVIVEADQLGGDCTWSGRYNNTLQ